MNNAINKIGQIYQRPWGSYQTIAQEPGYQAKIITVKAGGRLSLQKHFKRAEHWVVVAGVPTVTVGDNVKEYKINEHIYIPTEVQHRLENFTDEEVKIIEVQVGNYLGEDDIVRIEDVYDRK
jgi:mannose-6-phosphate isomerase